MEDGVSPAAGHERRGLLIHGFVRLGEEAQALPRRRRGKLSYGDAERDVATGLAFHDGKKVKLGELLRGIFLRKLPIAHPSIPRVGLLSGLGRQSGCGDVRPLVRVSQRDLEGGETRAAVPFRRARTRRRQNPRNQRRREERERRWDFFRGGEASPLRASSRSMSLLAFGEMPINSTPMPMPGWQYRTSQRARTSTPVTARRNLRSRTVPSGKLCEAEINMPVALTSGALIWMISSSPSRETVISCTQWARAPLRTPCIVLVAELFGLIPTPPLWSCRCGQTRSDPKRRVLFRSTGKIRSWPRGRGHKRRKSRSWPGERTQHAGPPPAWCCRHAPDPRRIPA